MWGLYVLYAKFASSVEFKISDAQAVNVAIKKPCIHVKSLAVAVFVHSLLAMDIKPGKSNSWCKRILKKIQALPKIHNSFFVLCGLFYLGKRPGHTLQHAFITVIFDWQMQSNKMHILVLIIIPCPKTTWQICDFDSISFCWLQCSVIAWSTWLPDYAYHQYCSLKWPQFTSFGSLERTWNELLYNKEAAVMQNKRQAKESFGLMRLSECLPCITSYLTAFEHGFFSPQAKTFGLLFCVYAPWG